MDTEMTMEAAVNIRERLRADEPVSDDEVRAALQFLRKDRTAVPTAGAKKGSSKVVAAPSLDDFGADL